MSKKSKGMLIDWETASRITVLNLKDCKTRLEEDIEKFETKKSPGKGDQLDYLDNIAHLKAVNKVLEYFGEHDE